VRLARYAILESSKGFVRRWLAGQACTTGLTAISSKAVTVARGAYLEEKEQHDTQHLPHL